MKELLKRLESATAAMNEIDDRYEADPENEELEALWESMYTAEYEARVKLAAAVVSFTSGKIDPDTAVKMTYNPKLAELIGRLC